MTIIMIEKAAVQFGKGTPSILQLGEGLIHRTYKISFTQSPAIVLQCINQTSFSQPENIINNYRLIQDHLQQHSNLQIPRLLQTHHNKYYWIDPEENFWRATSFMENSYARSLPENAMEVYAAAQCFASFTQALSGIDTDKFETIIPNFHNLAFRYHQFEEAILSSTVKRLLKATHIISEIRNRIALVEFYLEVEKNPTAYPTRIMHHDCKISNVLFNSNTQSVICPVDLDTVMPGKYFSDMGDMIRTMSCTLEENSNAWELIDVKPDYYQAIVKGYTEGMGNALTPEERKHIHLPGKMLTYMQCIRFVTDFLNNDIYYKTNYPEQNLNRALNQLILLEKLEAFTKS